MILVKNASHKTNHESDSNQYLQINEIIQIKLIKYINKYDSHEIN